ncbi:MAG: SGNH/GDSL hydrolase family protein [Planctomycetes bacterium]|nr:SGNH/GDSL hydrolase family protein [Planctomycetota bacterium]MBL7041039.1 SGNH/GDSL hydrolase family protein [Pirellulaceae bacterium]
MRPVVQAIVILTIGSAALAKEPPLYSSKEAWQRVVPVNYQRRPEFAFVEADTRLPHVLLIGDSISMSYTVGVRQRLAGIANVYRAPDNCRSTRQTLAEIETYLGGVDWDVIHFNWGIHDITHLNDEGRVAPPPEGKHQVGLEQYTDNLRKLVERLKKTNAKLVWASTTPVGQKTEVKGYRRDRDVAAYNAVAAEVLTAEQIAINDLYAPVKPRAEELLSDGVHFTRKGQEALAKAVSEAIRSQLIWFREDFTETPPEIPVQQEHLANPDLILTRLGPGEGQIKRSFHENTPGDPHYVWSGLCPRKWAIAFEHRVSSIDLSGRGKVRWRTKQSADRVLRVIVNTGDGWLVSDRGTPQSEDWIIDEIDLTECRWFRLDIESVTKGELVENLALSRVREIGFTDLMPGGQSKACSRLDWIEVYGKVNQRKKTTQ